MAIKVVDNVVGYDGLENNLKSYRDQFKCPSQAEVENNHPNSENKATLYTWGPCENGIYVKHLKLEGRQHSPSKADVSDIWNFVKGYDLDGPIGASKPESSSSEVASSADAAKSSSSGGQIGPAVSSSSRSFHRSSSSAEITSSATEALPMDPSLRAVSVYKTSDSYIMVTGAQGKSITVFNSLGNVVSSTRALGSTQKVYTGAKGVYIVKVGTRTFKISL